jgi:hypothetical protein
VAERRVRRRLMAICATAAAVYVRPIRADEVRADRVIQ